MSPDQVQCPYCLKHVQLRQDGKMAKHTVSSAVVRGGKPCTASELTVDRARELKATGATSTETKPEEIF